MFDSGVRGKLSSEVEKVGEEMALDGVRCSFDKGDKGEQLGLLEFFIEGLGVG